MPQASPAQRAEAARLLALRESDGVWYTAYEDAGKRLLDFVPLLLADAGALAERERADEVRRVGPAGDRARAGDAGDTGGDR